MSGGWRIWRLPLVVVAALILPVLILGLAFEEQVQAWVAGEWPSAVRFWVIVAALSGDILLPVPSSGVSTYAGGTLGFGWGTLASWLGMTLGAAGGFALAQWLGQPFAERYASDDLRTIADFSETYGSIALILSRPLPLLAEACVLLTGASRMTWRRFLPPVLASNLVISLAYAATGAHFRDRGALPQAVIASVLVPLAMTIVVKRARRRMSSRGNGQADDGSASNDGG